jgi:hypothetical protein
MVPPPPPPLVYRPPYIEKMARLLEIRVQKQQLVNLLGQHQPHVHHPPPPQQQ